MDIQVPTNPDIHSAHKHRSPWQLLLPLFLLLLSFYSIHRLFGTIWNTGAFSYVFVPYIGPQLAQSIGGEKSITSSSFVLIFYALSSISWYGYALLISKNRITALLMGLLILLPSFPLFPNFPDRLLHGLTRGDGGHIASLGILPLALIAFEWFLKNGNRTALTLYALLTTLIGLLSFFSVAVIFIFQVVLTTATILLSSGKIKIKRLLGSVFIVFGLLVLIYNGAIAALFFSDAGRSVFTVFQNLIPISFFLVPVLGIIIFLVFDRRPQLSSLFIAFSCALIFGLLNFVGVFIVDSSVFNKIRFSAEAEITQAFLIAYLLTSASALVRNNMLPKNWLPTFVSSHIFARIIEISSIVILTLCILFIPRSV